MLAFDFRILADVDAGLNALATILIVAGLIAIKAGKRELHTKLMLAAAAVSALFLICYLTYHANADPVRFQGEGVARTIYFAILIPHVILAAVQVPLIVLVIRAGLKDEIAKHRKLAKVTAPIWLFVSVTGVVIYFMLYH